MITARQSRAARAFRFVGLSKTMASSSSIPIVVWELCLFARCSNPVPTVWRRRIRGFHLCFAITNPLTSTNTLDRIQ